MAAMTATLVATNWGGNTLVKCTSFLPTLARQSRAILQIVYAVWHCGGRRYWLQAAGMYVHEPLRNYHNLTSKSSGCLNAHLSNRCNGQNERAAAEFRQRYAAGGDVASLQDKTVALSLIFGAESLKNKPVRYVLRHQG